MISNSVKYRPETTTQKDIKRKGRKIFMNIDMHIHITPPDIIRDYKKIGQKEPYFRLLSETPHNRFATYEEVAAHLKESQFQKGIVFGFGFQDMGLCRYVNDYTMEAVQKYPDLLTGFMTLPPTHPKMKQEIIRCAESGLCGIGEIFPEGQKIPLDTIHQSGWKELLKHYRLILLVHANETVGHYYAGKTKVSMHEIETFVRNHSEIPIILAHFGGGILFFELMKELREAFCNVYYDTAAGIFLYEEKIYSALREIGILDKILFGSDYPLLPIARYLPSFDGLSEAERNGILGGNAERLLAFRSSTGI